MHLTTSRPTQFCKLLGTPVACNCANRDFSASGILPLAMDDFIRSKVGQGNL
jgi:hypothetical protein